MPIIKPPFFNFQSAAEILAYLSGEAGATFDFNNQTVSGLPILDAGSGYLTLTSTGELRGLIIKQTNAAARGALLQLYANSSSPAVNDGIGEIYFLGKDSAGNDFSYGRIIMAITNKTDGSEEGRILFYTTLAGAENLAFELSGAGALWIDDALTIGGALTGVTDLTVTGTTTLATALTGVLRGDSGVVSVDSDVTDIVTAATTTAAGKVELAIASEINTGTDATRANSPDALAGSNFGIRYIQEICFDFTTDCATGDGKGYAHIPAGYNGMNLVEVHAECITAGTTNTMDIQIHNLTQTADMLSTVITIDSTETGSDTAATPAVIDTNNDDVATNDLIRIDVDAVHTTAAKGLIVTLGFQLP